MSIISCKTLSNNLRPQTFCHFVSNENKVMCVLKMRDPIRVLENDAFFYLSKTLYIRWNYNTTYLEKKV